MQTVNKVPTKVMFLIYQKQLSPSGWVNSVSEYIYHYSPSLWRIVVYYKHHFLDIPNVFQIWSAQAGYEELAVSGI